MSKTSPSQQKIILDLCGGTGSWSKPYKEAGYDVRLVTLPDLDVRTYEPPEGVYGILAAPPCTMFSFARTKAVKPRNLQEGMEIVKACLEIIWKCQSQITNDAGKTSPLKFWALENPNGMLKWFLGKPAFEFNPFDFGDQYKKRTHLWGDFEEPIKNPTHPQPLAVLPKFDRLLTKEIHPEYYGIYDRTTRRAITPPKFAKAFFEANR